MSDKKHAHVLSELYAHPIAHNIKWLELIPALSSVGLMHEEKNGSHHFTRNGHTVVFEFSNGETLSEDEILKLRHSLYSSIAPEDETTDLTKDVIVAISYHQAVIFYNPGEATESRQEEHADLRKSRVLHKRPTAPPYSNVGPIFDDDFYEAVIKDLIGARRIVVLSHGKGSSNAASQLMLQIHQKRPELSQRIAAVQRCDLEAMTEPQIIGLGKKLLGIERPY